MMTRLFSIAGFAACILFAAPAMAQQDPNSTQVEELTIYGGKKTPQEEKKRIETYVETLAAESPTGQMGRWDREICLNFTGFSSEYVNLIRARMAETAAPLGLLVDQPGCQPNLFIVATADGEGWLKAHLKQNKRFFRGDEYTVRIGQGTVNDFISSDRPVRWLFLTARVTRDGKRYEEGSIIEGRGRIGATVRADFGHAIVLLDFKHIGRQINKAALVDYVTMVSLAQIRPDARLPDVPSVLNLFEHEGQDMVNADGLTDYDTGYLQGLYGAKRDAKSSGGQRYEIRETIEGKLIKVSQ